MTRLDSRASPLTDISDDKKTTPKVYCNFTPSNESDTSHHDHRHQKERNMRHLSRRQYRSPTLPASRRNILESGLNVLVPYNGSYQKGANYQSYPPIYISQRHDGNMASEIQKMRKEVVIQMKVQAFHSTDSVSVIKFSTEIKRACI